MKPKFNRFFAAVIGAAASLSSSASAAQLFKDSTGTDINTLANWSTVNGATTPDPASFTTTDQLRLNENAAASGTFTMDLSGNLSVGNITVDSGTGSGGSATANFVINSANNSTLTLNGGGNASYITSGIVLNSATGGTLTVNCNISLGASPVRFTTSRALTVNGDISLGSNTLEFNTAGSTTTLAGIISGTGGLNKAQGGSTLALTNTANSFGGQVTLVGGTTNITKLANIGSNSSFGTGNGASSIIMNGATLTYTGAGGDTTNRAIDMRAGTAINNNSATGAISFTAANVIQSGTASARTFTLGGTNSGDNTLGSVLGDSGTGANITSLNKNNSGRWVLTGANSYTGTTTINQGTLAVTGSGVLGGAAGSTADANNIVFGSSNANAALQFEAVSNLGAAGQIRFRNTGGTAGQGGALVYTGTTNVSLGKTIQCDSSIGMRIESNSVGGSLTLNGAFDQSNRPLYLGGTGTGGNTLATAYNGTGVLTKRDAGTWLLSASNGYSGGTELLGGKLRVNALSGIGSGYLAVKNGSTFVYQASGSETTTRNLFMDNDAANIEITNSTGSLTWNPGGGTRNQAFTKTGAGTLELGGAISGSGSVTVSGGTLKLTGANSYTGSTNVAQGTLVINGSVSTGAVTVESGATLMGGGTIGGATTINSGAILSPGNSPGLLTVNNALTLAGTTLMEIGGTTIETEYDSIDVSGLLTYGGILNLISYNSYNLAQAASYNLFGVGGGEAGTFNSVSVGGLSLTGLDGVWSAENAGYTYTFTESTGTLVVIPEPAAALLGGVGMLLLLRRRRVG